jgi:hypothetical protein
VLRAAGLVQTRRDAQTIFYGLVDSPALAVLQALHDAYCAPKRSRAQAAPRKAPWR